MLLTHMSNLLIAWQCKPPKQNIAVIYIAYAISYVAYRAIVNPASQSLFALNISYELINEQRLYVINNELNSTHSN